MPDGSQSRAPLHAVTGILLAIMVLPTPVSANGGPVAWDENDGFGSVGAVVPITSDSIALEKEEVTLDYHLMYTVGEVHYVLRNDGEATTVKFGFPFLVYGEMDEGETSEVTYSISVDGEPTGFKTSRRKRIPFNQTIKALFPGGKSAFTDAVGMHPLWGQFWYDPWDHTQGPAPQRASSIFMFVYKVSELEFDAGEKHDLHIRFVTYNYIPIIDAYIEKIGGDDSDVMTTEGFSYFSYLTHPAQGWKDKVEIADFTLRIHGDPIWKNPNRELPNIYFHPKPHVTEGKEFHWHYEDWEPEEPIIIAVPLSIGRPYPDAPDANDVISNWRNDACIAKTLMNIYEDSIIQPSEIVSVNASSHLEIDPKKEPSRTEPLGTRPENAFDADPFASAWITGADKPNGIGAELTVTLSTPQAIKVVGIVSGYHLRENAEYYKRPKTIEILMDGGISETWELEDRERDLYVLETSLQTYKLPEAVTTKSVTLVINEVFPSKYKTRPAAISEVLLFKAPPKPVEKAPQEDPAPEETSAAKTVKVQEDPEPAEGRGCSCEMAGGEPSHFLAVILALALLGFLSRRSWK